MKILMFVVMIINSNYVCLGQQLLMKINIVNKSLVGYGVEMYYIFDSVESMIEDISSIKQFSERDILQAFRYPIVDQSFAEFPCNIEQLKLIDINKLMKHSRNLTVVKNCYEVTFTFSFAFFEYCVFNLSDNFFGSYDISVKKAAVIKRYHQSKVGKTKAYIQKVQSLLMKVP